MVNKHCSILLVDPDQTSAALLSKGLKQYGHSVFNARDVAHAFSILEFRAFEVLIIGLDDSRTDGLDLIAWAATLVPKPRIVAAGNARGNEVEQEILARGASLLLHRPVELQAIQDFIVRTRSRSSFSGAVEGVDIIEYVQFVMLGGKKTILEVTSSVGTSGRLFLTDGHIVHAECGVLRGEPALYRSLCFKEGTFSHATWEDPEEITINKPGEFILMEAVRKRDDAWGDSFGESNNY